MTNTVLLYTSPDGATHHWRVDRKDDDSGEVSMVAKGRDSGYATKDEALTSLFSMFFGSYDESFLAAYNEWDPNHNRLGT